MSGNRYLFDTNFVIYYLNAQPKAQAFFDQLAGGSFSISVMTRLELLSHPGITADDEEAIQEFIDRVAVLPLVRDVEKNAILIRRATRAKTPDAIIAASAICLDATLVTSDKVLASTSYPGLRIINPMSL